MPEQTMRAACRRWLDRLGFVGLSSSVFTWGLVRGVQTATIRLDLVVIGLFVLVDPRAVLSGLLFATFMIAAGTLFVGRVVGGGRPTPETGARVTAVVPVYGDAAVLGRSVESLRRSVGTVDVVVVCEPDDGASIRRAEELGVDYLVNTRAPGSKAGAINYAAAVTDSPYLAVFDADEVVHPEFPAAAVDRLEAGADVVQGRTVPEPTGPVETLAYYESVLLSYVARRPLYLLTGFRMAASRAVVMHRSAFDRAGGYDPSMLTEDFAFAYACYRARLDVRDLPGYPSRITAAHGVRDWWGQRKRWMTGYVQVLWHLTLDALPPADRRDALSVLICASTVAGSLLTLSLFGKFAVLGLLVAVAALDPSQVGVLPAAGFTVPLAAVSLVALTVRGYDARQGVVDGVGWGWLFVPLVAPLYSLAALKAVTEYALSWDGEWYRVEKAATDASGRGDRSQ